MNKKHSSILNLQIKIVQSGKLPENSTWIILAQHSIFGGIVFQNRENMLLLNHHIFV